MAQFTVRVELHDAQWPDYVALHAAMQRQGFSRQIRADNGLTYEMPWAEYDATSTLSSMDVLGVAQRAANSTGKKNSVFVTEAKARTWSGLALASK